MRKVHAGIGRDGVMTFIQENVTKNVQNRNVVIHVENGIKATREVRNDEKNIQIVNNIII